MRFHLGLSLPIRKLLPFIGFLFVGLLAFFGIDKLTAHAATFNASGYDVHAYRPNYNNNTVSGSATTLYNATGCNNVTIDNNTYCMFQNSNSSSYFSRFDYITNNSQFLVPTEYYTNNNYRPHSRLVWRWKQSAFANLCPNSTSIILTFHVIMQANNSLMGSNVWTTGAKLCADDLNSVTGSIGSCDMNVYVNSQKFSAVQFSHGNSTGNYNVTIGKPTTDVEFEVPQIQPLLRENGGEGGSYSNATFNYGIRISAYECGSTDTSNQDVINAIQGSSSAIINNDNNNTNSINSNITNSANAIVDSIEDLKDNQDENTQEIIDSHKVCDELIIDKKYIFTDNHTLTSSGSISGSTNVDFGVTDYIDIHNATSLKVISTRVNLNQCFYDISKSVISCTTFTSLGDLSIPSGAYYLRMGIDKVQNIPTLAIYFCKNGNQAIYDSMNDDSYNNNGQLGGLDGKFNDYGIDDLARAPLSLLSEIYNSSTATCSSLVLPISIGNSNANASIPCGSGFWSMFPSSAVSLYQTLVFGLSGWFIIKKLIKLIENSLDPDDKSDMINSL